MYIDLMLRYNVFIYYYAFSYDLFRINNNNNKKKKTMTCAWSMSASLWFKNYCWTGNNWCSSLVLKVGNTQGCASLKVLIVWQKSGQFCNFKENVLTYDSYVKTSSISEWQCR
jgi:hypothetical protein